MLKSIKEKLRKQIDLEVFFSNKLYLSAFHGIFLFIFLNLFKPFKLVLLKLHFYGYSALISVLYFIIPLFFLSLCQKLKFNKSSILKIILTSILFLCVLCIITWGFSRAYKDVFLLYVNKLSLFRFSKYSFSMALITFPLLYVINDKITQLKSKKKVELPIIPIEFKTIYSENKKETLNIKISNIVYITSEGNYACIFVLENSTLKELIMRNTLTKIMSQIHENTNIFRCHKSYIVNTKFMNNISGNSRGYFYESDIISIKIPISRTYKKEELQQLIS